MLVAKDALSYRQQRGELVPGGGSVTGAPGPVGQAGAGGQCIGVLGTKDALSYGQQRRELVPGGGSVTGLTDRVGALAPHGQGTAVLGTWRRGCLDRHIANGRERVGVRGYLPGTQYGLGLLDQGLQVRLSVRVLLQQVREAPRPPDRQSRADHPRIRPVRADELLARLLQAFLG